MATEERVQMPMRDFRHPAGACAVTVLALGWQCAAFASDMLLIHGHVYSGNRQAPWAAAVAITATRIEAVGDDAHILKRRGAHTRVIDLHGQTVIPGIVDSHMHLLYGAIALHGLNLSTPSSSVTPDKPRFPASSIRTCICCTAP